MSDAGGPTGPIVLAAGGTGGHLFPAQALAEALQARGHDVVLVTDPRGDRYRATFPAREVHIVPSATIGGRDPVALARTGFRLGKGLMRSLSLLRRLKPAVLVGFGGYPTLPPLIAARLLGVRTAIHEQNAVLGRANRMLASRVDLVATSFPEVRLLGDGNRDKAVYTGAPVRAAVKEAAGPYDAAGPNGDFRLLVFGGSQGAKVFSDVMADAVGLLDENHRARLKIVQQVREEDMARVAAAYEAIGVAADIAPFFADMPARIAASHLVVSRSGASTVAELAVIGRPAILVPLPHAVDNDQLLNARAMDAAGGGWLIEQNELTPERRARDIAGRMDEPDALAAAAKAAGRLGNDDAAGALADAVVALARGLKPTQINSGRHS